MSRVFVESFFPETIQRIQSSATTRSYYEYVFSLSTQEQCPEVVLGIPVVQPWRQSNDTTSSDELTTTMIQIRNPFLFLWASIGAILGMYCSISLLLVFRLRKNGETNNQQRRYPLWIFSFLGFSAMNLVAIPLHCLCPVHEYSLNVYLPRRYPLLWSMDTFFTGAFCSAVVCASLQEHVAAFYQRKSQVHQSKQWMVFVLIWLFWCLAVGVGCIVAFKFWNFTLPLELWYLHSLLPAVVSGTPLLVSDATMFGAGLQEKIPLIICTMAVLASLLGVLMDGAFCEVTHGRPALWLDIGRAPAVAFGACDAAFYGLFHRLHVQYQQVPRERKIM